MTPNLRKIEGQKTEKWCRWGEKKSDCCSGAFLSEGGRESMNIYIHICLSRTNHTELGWIRALFSSRYSFSLPDWLPHSQCICKLTDHKHSARCTFVLMKPVWDLVYQGYIFTQRRVCDELSGTDGDDSACKKSLFIMSVKAFMSGCCSSSWPHTQTYTYLDMHANARAHTACPLSHTDAHMLRACLPNKAEQSRLIRLNDTAVHPSSAPNEE